LEKRAEQVLPGSEEGMGGRGRGAGEGEGGDWGKKSGGQRGEMAQTMYIHMNKCINNFLKGYSILCL
jgi:hypothetical protein